MSFFGFKKTQSEKSEGALEKETLPPSHVFTKKEIVDTCLGIMKRLEKENCYLKFNKDNIESFLDQIPQDKNQEMVHPFEERKFLVEDIEKYFPSTLKNIFLANMSFYDEEKYHLEDRPKNFNKYNKEEMFWKFLAEGRSKEIIDFLIKSIFYYDKQIPILLENILGEKRPINTIINELSNVKKDFLEKYQDELSDKNSFFSSFEKVVIPPLDKRVNELQYLIREMEGFLDDFINFRKVNSELYEINKDKQKEYGVEVINVTYFKDTQEIGFYWKSNSGRFNVIGYGIENDGFVLKVLGYSNISDKESKNIEDPNMILDLIKIFHNMKTPLQMKIEREEEERIKAEEARKKAELERIKKEEERRLAEQKKERERKRRISISSKMPQDETDPITVGNIEKQSDVEIANKDKFENPMNISFYMGKSDLIINEDMKEEMENDNNELYKTKINIEGMRPKKKKKEKEKTHISIKTELPKDENNF